MMARTYIPTVSQAVLIALLLIVGTALYAIAVFEPNKELRTVQNMVLENTAGDRVYLHDVVQGKVAVLNAWASWCPHCVTELPDFSLLQKEYGDEVVVVAINRKESAAQAKNYLAEHNINSGLTVLFDKNDAFYKSINGIGMPETIIVNAQRQIVLHKRGPMGLEEMRNHVRSAIE